jgi:hypothetical protein
LIRTDDNAPLHSKFQQAGLVAYGWWHAALSYCGRQLTDGFIPSRDLRLIFPMATPEEMTEAVEALVREGCLHKVEAGQRSPCGRRRGTCPSMLVPCGGVILHDYFDYQECARSARLRRRNLSTYGRQGGFKSAESRKSAPDTDPKSAANTGYDNPEVTRQERAGSTQLLQDNASTYGRQGGMRSGKMRQAEASSQSEANPRLLSVPIRSVPIQSLIQETGHHDASANGSPRPPLIPGVVFRIPDPVCSALDRCKHLGATDRLRRPEWWQAELRANPGVDLPGEVYKAEAYLVNHPEKVKRYKRLDLFLHGWLGRADREG